MPWGRVGVAYVGAKRDPPTVQKYVRGRVRRVARRFGPGCGQVWAAIHAKWASFRVLGVAGQGGRHSSQGKNEAGIKTFVFNRWSFLSVRLIK